MGHTPLGQTFPPSSVALGRQSSLSPRAPGAVRARKGGLPVLVCLLAFVGVVFIELPGIAAWFSQAAYSQQIVEMSEQARAADPPSRSEALAEARAYNASLIGVAAVVDGNVRIPQAAAGAEAEYSQLLRVDSTGLMARIMIPAIGVDLPIYHGTSDDVLARGVGHLQGTALPVGGASSHAVLTAHRGFATAELFTRLDEVVVGDEFSIEVYGEVLSYRVTETRVVEPTDTQSLYPVQGEDLVTLVTCTPLGVNTHRILVTGERVTPTPIATIAAAAKEPVVPGFPWWAVGLVATAAILCGYLYLAARQRREEEDPELGASAEADPGSRPASPAAR